MQHRPRYQSTATRHLCAMCRAIEYPTLIWKLTLHRLVTAHRRSDLKRTSPHSTHARPHSPIKPTPPPLPRRAVSHYTTTLPALWRLVGSLAHDRDIRARGPDLVALLAIPSPPQDVFSRSQVGGDAHRIHDLDVVRSPYARTQAIARKGGRAASSSLFALWRKAARSSRSSFFEDQS